MATHHLKPGTPGDVLAHHGVKGMKWGVRKEEDLVGREAAKKLTPGSPEFQQMIERLTRTDRPQMINPQTVPGSEVGEPKKKGLTPDQKLLLTYGVLGAGLAGYVAYATYKGRKLSDAKDAEASTLLERYKLPQKWSVKGLRDHPVSTQPLGDLAGGELGAKLHDAENLVVNTSRGYADIVPKNGFDTAFAAEQHASVTKVLEEMRDKYPSVRNMNIEVIPMSKVPGLENSSANMCVLPMRAGEARVMYNDWMPRPDAADIRRNSKFLPGLGQKDYVAYHEMGHVLAVAHGELPPAFDLLSGAAGPALTNKRQTAEPLLHRQMFNKHGFTFTELSKLSGYAATEPAEAMAELAGHYFHPEMQKRLTPDQVTRAKAMFDEMGGITE